MARPREFDTDEALKGATEIFWRQGYLATNLPDLLDAMGLTRGSFYKAFSDKENAYLEALDYYDRTVVSVAVRLLAECEGPNASTCLSVMFRTGDAPRRGCFICNAMVELAPVNPDVANRANAMATRLREAIRGVLDRFGVFNDPICAAEVADMILHLYFGHQAMGKSTDTRHDWKGRLAALLGESPQKP